MDKLQIIKKETEELLNKMVNKFSLEVKEDNGVFQIMIKADEEAPTVIGRHGETIRAIQKILEVVFYKQFGEAVQINVNVNDYREKQKEKLERMAAETAERVEESRQPSQLANLSSYERKTIHEFITNNHPNLTSYSVGEGRERKLVIDIKKDESTEKKST